MIAVQSRTTDPLVQLVVHQGRRTCRLLEGSTADIDMDIDWPPNAVELSGITKTKQRAWPAFLPLARWPNLAGHVMSRARQGCL